MRASVELGRKILTVITSDTERVAESDYTGCIVTYSSNGWVRILYGSDCGTLTNVGE